MLRNLILANLIVCCGAAAAVDDGPGQLAKDMADFDRAYIPALALTSQEKADAARVAFKRLEEAWRTFKGAHYAAKPLDPAWEEDLGRIGDRIDESKVLVREGKELKAAHEQLEEIRSIFLDMRRRHGIIYFLDYLTLFHEPMEEIVLLAKDKTPQTFSSEDVEKLRALVPKAQVQWRNALNGPVDAPAFGLNAERRAQVKAMMARETEALERLEAAATGDDKAEMIQAAVGIKPPFAKLFMFFGDFPGGTPMAQAQDTFTMQPIGYVRKEDGKTALVIDEAYTDGLLRLDQLSEIWVLWWFDKSDTPEKRAILQVHPRGNPDNPLTGVFATHAPVRPNLIAMTRCKIVAVKGNVIEVEDIDAFDGTPVLDIKS